MDTCIATKVLALSADMCFLVETATIPAHITTLVQAPLHLQQQLQSQQFQLLQHHFHPPSSSKSVINISSIPLTSTQEAPLARGPNFTVVTKYPQGNMYITTIRRSLHQTFPREAEELRPETS